MTRRRLHGMDANGQRSGGEGGNLEERPGLKDWASLVRVVTVMYRTLKWRELLDNS